MPYVASSIQTSETFFDDTGDVRTIAYDAGTGLTDGLLVVDVGFNGSGSHTIGVPTFDGIGMTEVGSLVTAGNSRLRTFVMTETTGASGNHNFVVDPSTGPPATTVEVLVQFRMYDQIDQTTPFDAASVQTVAVAADDASIDLPAVTSETGDRVLFAAYARGLTPTDIALSTGTRRGQDIDTSTAAIMAVGDADGAASVTITGTLTATFLQSHVGKGVNLNASAGGGGGGLPKKFALRRARSR